MQDREVYVYVFTGFLESGKTSLIQGTLEEPDFMTGEKGLLICCEEGEIEYKEDLLKKLNMDMVVVEEEEDLTPAYLEELNKKYSPDRVFIEYNGMWNTENMIEMEMPEEWIIVQVLTTIDASTFQGYMNNMGGMMVQQFTPSDAVIINRCDENTPTASFRRLIKANNRRAQIIYEHTDGTIDNGMEEEMPFDLNADVVEISEEDYGIWYMDALEHPEKYKNKKLSFKAIVYHPDEFPPEWVVPGRFAMTCCVDDIQFIGFKCHCKDGGKFQTRDWVNIVVTAKVQYTPEYQGEGLVLEAVSIEKTEKSKEEIVYFT